MNLHEYLASEDGMTASALAAAIGIKNVAQIRQWQHNYAGRLPGAENCVSIEQATKGVVRRWDLRPEDWHLIWPELIDVQGAPPVPVKEPVETAAAAGA